MKEARITIFYSKHGTLTDCLVVADRQVVRLPILSVKNETSGHERGTWTLRIDGSRVRVEQEY